MTAPVGAAAWLRRLLERLLPEGPREFVAGDLAELHADRRQHSGTVWAEIRWAGDLLASALVLRRDGARGRRAAHVPPQGALSSVGSSGSGGRGDGPWWAGLDALAGEVRNAYRALARQPGLVSIVTIVLGIGVGAAATVFGIANEVLLRPPPGVADPGSAAFVEFGTPERPDGGISGPDVIAIREAATLLDGFATFDELNQLHAAVPGRRPLIVHGAAVHGDCFELLGVRALAGRLLAASETGPGADLYRAVISERLWDELYDRSPAAVGGTILLDDSVFTVIGVAGGGFRGVRRGAWSTDVWTPRASYAFFGGPPVERLWSTGSTLNQAFVARPTAGVALAAVETELNGLLDGLAEANPGRGEFLRALDARVYGGLNLPPYTRAFIAPLLAVLATAGLLILLLPCLNVANLLLVRALDARGEAAVRRALGASRGAVARQALVESLLLGLLGTAAGLLVAGLLGLAIRGESLLGLPELQGFALDSRVMAFAAAAVVLTAALSGTLPALISARTHPAGALRRASPHSTEPHGALRSGMAAVQLALSLTLLVGSLLAVRTVRNLHEVDSGLRIGDVQVVSLDLGASPPDGAAFTAFQTGVDEALRSVPGVQQVAFHAVFGPFGGGMSERIAPARAAGDLLTATRHPVTPDWFDLLEVRAVAGRTLRPGDAADAGVRPIVLTAPLARRLFGRLDAVGERVTVGWQLDQEAEVVGVVGDLRLSRLTDPPDEAWFDPYPAAQKSPMTILVRTVEGGMPGEALRRAITQAVPGLPVPRVDPLAARIDDQLAEQRILARLLTLLATLAVLLAAVGLYGVLAYTARRRRREFAIRIALGADGLRIGALVARAAALVVAAGVVVGLAGGLALSRLLAGRLFGIGPGDPTSYAGAAVLLALVAGVATWVPARAAQRVDPAAMLRED